MISSVTVAAFALMEQEKDPELSLLLATEAVKTMHNANDPVLPLSNTVLRQSIIKSRVRLALTGHDHAIWSASYSPDDARLVTGCLDQTAWVWNAQTGYGMLRLVKNYSF